MHQQLAADGWRGRGGELLQLQTVSAGRQGGQCACKVLQCPSHHAVERCQVIKFREGVMLQLQTA